MTDLTSILPYVEKYAPDLAKLIPPPFGTLLSYGLSSIFNVTSSSPQDLANAIQADPNAEFKLKQFQLEHKDLISKLNSSDYQATLSDVQDARKMEVEKEEKTGKTDWVLNIIALSVIIAFISMTFLIAITTFNASDHDVLFTLIGQLSSGFIAVLSFFFGSIRNN